MTTDSRKYLVITYNALNLQQSLSQNGTTVASYTWLADGTKCGVVDNNNNGYDYTGSLIYSRSGSVRTPESIENGAGRIMYSGGTYNPHYYITDHLGSTRVITDNSGSVVERDDYYPFGGQLAISTYPQLSVNRFKFNGKELQTTGNTGFQDYGARMYDDVIGRWGVVDPMAEKYCFISSYVYCANSSVLLIDPTGLDWFWFKEEGQEEPSWNWRDGNEYHTGVKDENGKEVVLQGQEAVVTFDGSVDEHLGGGQNINGDGAKLADVTVYGPGGENDIKHYKGYSMSSDPTKFGVVADGDYTVNRLSSDEKPGPYGSDLVLESRGAKIPEQDNYNPAFPNRNPAYLQGVFIHRTNNNGWAGWKYDKNGQLYAVSQGCLLIAPNQWKEFHQQLQSVNSFLLQIRR
jgi:RHS repeat-associated protein